MPKQSYFAAIAGDIVDSTRLKPKEREAVTDFLARHFSENAGSKAFNLHRGDAFQVVFPAAKGLRQALYLRARLKSEFKTPVDARIAIGLGEVSDLHKDPGRSDGTALQLSGRALDALKKEEKQLSVVTGHHLIDLAFEAITELMDFHIRHWSQAQAEALRGRMEGKTYDQIAAKLNLSRSACFQRIVSSRWPQMQQSLVFYDAIIQKYFSVLPS